MSHNNNNPYRRPPSDSDLRPGPRRYSSSDRRHASSSERDRPYGTSDRHHASSSERDFSRPPRESSSSRGAPWSQDGALSILSSCGLEPADLALLAELPEDVLTVESLPQVLRQIKGKRGPVNVKGKRETIKPFPSAAPSPSSSSYPSSSSRLPAVNPPSSSAGTAGDWNPPRSHLPRYPLDPETPGPESSALDHWGNPRTGGSSGRTDPPSSLLSSSYVVDFQHRPGPFGYSQTVRDYSPVSSQDFQHRAGLSDYNQTGKDAAPVSLLDYNLSSGTSEFGQTGRDYGLVSSQDYNPRPGSSDYSKKGKDPTPVSLLDYNFSPGPPEFGHSGRDNSSVSSQDFQHRPGPSVYGQMGRDGAPVSLLAFNFSSGPSYGKTGRDAGPVSSQDYNLRPGLSEYIRTGSDRAPVPLLDYDHRPLLSDYGKTGTDAGAVSSQGPPSFSSAAGRDKRTRPSRFSQPGPALPPEEQRPKPPHQSETPSIHSASASSSSRTAASMPSKKEALDFHGASPPTFPYSCALCDITVMSKKVSTPVLTCSSKPLCLQSLMGGLQLSEASRVRPIYSCCCFLFCFRCGRNI